MQDLAQQHCTACDKNASLLKAVEIETLLTQLPNWQVVNQGGIKKLTRDFKTRNYKNSLAFTNAVAQLAESVNHHPLLIVDYAQVTVIWWSHNIKGLHQNDFILAAKTSLLCEQY